jgi:hypothetical protein
VPLRIFADVTALRAIFGVVTAPDLSCGAPTLFLGTCRTVA